MENLVILGDNIVKTKKYLKKGSVHLLYTDPPWKTDKRWLNSDDEGTIGYYEDMFTTVEDYLEFIYDRVNLWKEYLVSNGHLVLHLHSKYSADIKVQVLDKIFSPNQYRGTIIWPCKRWTASTKNIFNNVHQDLLWYTNAVDYNYIYNEQRIPLEKPRKRNLVRDRKSMRDESGDVVYKTQVDTPVTDVWYDINPVPNKGGERVDYPTQKPLAIPDRLIKTLTNEGNIVFDPFMGSGTTLVAASNLNRKFIGMDNEETAFKKTKERLREEGIGFKTLNGEPINVKGIDELSDYEYQCLIVEKLKGIPGPKGSDDGIDGRNKNTNTSIAVTRGRITRQKVSQFEADSKREGFKNGIFVSPQKPTTTAKGLAAKMRMSGSFNLVLMLEEDVLGKYEPEVKLEINGFNVEVITSGFRNPIVNYAWFVNCDDDRIYIFKDMKYKVVKKEEKTGMMDFTGKLESGRVHHIKCVVSDSKGHAMPVEINHMF